MIQQLLELPPELLAHILSLLSVQDLLKFSQASHQARSLANSNIHTLRLGIHLTQPSYLTRRVDIEIFRRLLYRPLALAQQPSIPPSDRDDEQLVLIDETETQETAQTDRDAEMIWIRIDQAHLYDDLALLKFHDAFFQSILHRHGQMLQTLHLCLWTLTTNVAGCIARLSALRVLSINIEADQSVRPVPRSYTLKERLVQRKAWGLLARNAMWSHHLRVLKIENADLNPSQLGSLLHSIHVCKDLALRNCRFIGKELWELLSSMWPARATLQRLTVAECGGVLDERSLDAIGQLHGLQYLNLHGCVGMDKDVIEERNKGLWKIPEMVGPRGYAGAQNLVIEVDPAYV